MIMLWGKKRRVVPLILKLLIFIPALITGGLVVLLSLAGRWPHDMSLFIKFLYLVKNFLIWGIPSMLPGTAILLMLALWSLLSMPIVERSRYFIHQVFSVAVLSILTTILATDYLMSFFIQGEHIAENILGYVFEDFWR